MIASLNEEEGSPSDLAERLGCSVHNTSYHMRCLLKFGYVEVVNRVRVGSAVKTVYRAKVEVNLPKEMWEKFPPSVQQLLVVQAFMGGFGDIEVALLYRIFQKWPESHASWSHFGVDDQGWMELVSLADRTLEEATAIRDASKERSGEGTHVVSMNLSLFPLPDKTEQIESRAGELRRTGGDQTTVRHVSDPEP